MIESQPNTKQIITVVGVIGIIAYACITITPLIIPNIFPPKPLSPSPTSTLPPTFDATVSRPDYCHNGPNESYGAGEFIVPAGTNATVLGMALEGDWFMIKGVGIDPCWIKAGTLKLSPSFDIERVLKFVTAYTVDNSYCFVTPNTDSEWQTIIPGNWRIVAYGKSNEEADWVLVVPHNSTEFCWVERTDLSGFENVYLPIQPVDIAFTSTPLPTDTPTFTPTSTPTNTPTVTSKPPVYYTPTKTRRSNDGGNKNTPGPKPTNTSRPPTNTPHPLPTNTPVPPPPPTSTPIPPTPTLCWPPGHCK